MPASSLRVAVAAFGLGWLQSCQHTEEQRCHFGSREAQAENERAVYFKISHASVLQITTTHTSMGKCNWR
jgi:hypothetical protein